ncbi:hypothetical protein ElyMa_006172600 [Elysia marginata]|uniref:Uncharacterized protein n=1 Tax=Elysia marginata TaxID=1093978 RepID=A0AAV4H0Z6_9GAST|nr:hypothetical protein ElyMa_006172600 [Elysia marginata]
MDKFSACALQAVHCVQGSAEFKEWVCVCLCGCDHCGGVCVCFWKEGGAGLAAAATVAAAVVVVPVLEVVVVVVVVAAVIVIVVRCSVWK